MKQRILTNWHFSRVLRLILGIWVLVSAMQNHDWPIGLFSGLFIFTAITNTGCCGAHGCAVPAAQPLEEQRNEI